MPLIIPAAVLLLLALIGYVFFRKKLRSLESQVKAAADEISALRGELEAMLSGSRGVGEKLRHIEGQIRQQNDKQHQLGRQGPDANSMKQAIELARKGATTEELISICGLSHGEAELLVMMHRSRSEQQA